MERLTYRSVYGTAIPQAKEAEITERLAAYEDAEEQGLIVRLPCKVGNTVYRLQFVDDWEKPGFFTVGVAETTFSIYLLSAFGKTVFSTREEAALAKEE